MISELVVDVQPKEVSIAVLEDKNLSDAQKEAIIAVCRETYYAASIIARAYAFKAAEVLRHHEPE